VAPKGTGPTPHPEPPDDLHSRTIPLLTTQQSWTRIFRRQHAPLYFGWSPDRRFDPPTRVYRVLYVAADAHGAFIETLGHQTGIRLVTTSALQSLGVAILRSHAPLRLVDLTAAGLAQIGADERLGAGEYTIAQRWSLALFRHPAKPDGLYYRSRHDPSRMCAAIFHRAARKVTVEHHSALTDPQLGSVLAEILNTYHFGLIDDADEP
jgi:hypothetical protein